MAKPHSRPVSDGDACSCCLASLGTAPPGPFPTAMFLAVIAVFVGCVLAIIGMKELSDAWLDGMLEERPSLAINLSLAYVNIAVLTTFGVFGYAVYARSLYLMYKEEVEAGAPHDASQPWRGPKPVEATKKDARKGKPSALGAFQRPCLLLAQLFTVAALALCITMLLVLAAAVLASVSADYACAEVVLEGSSPIAAALAAVVAAADAPPLELASGLCAGLDIVESTSAPDSCFKLDIALGIISALLGQWPLHITQFEPLATRLSGACASFSSAAAEANVGVCTPLFRGNASAIGAALATAGSSMTVDQYVTSSVDFSPNRLRFLALRAAALLSNADETLREVYAVGRDLCTTRRTVHLPLERLLIASAVMLLGTIISRACFVRYVRFMGCLAAPDGPHWAPVDAVVAALLLLAGMMLGASALGWAAQAYQSEVAASGVVAAPSIAPTVTAAVCACVFCILVALLVVLYGVGTRRLLRKQSRKTSRRGHSSAPGRILLQLLVGCVWLLTVALVLISCLSVGAAVGGRLVGRHAVEGADLMHRQLMRPPTRLVNESGEAARQLYNALVPPPNASLSDPAPTASGLNPTQLCFVYSDLAATEAPVRRSCVLASFATRMVVRLANAPPFSAGINGSEYAMDCSRLPAALAAGRTSCATAPTGTPNLAGALADEALLGGFLHAYRHLIIFNRIVGDASRYVYVSLDALVGPFVRLLIASVILIAGTALLGSAFSRYTMMEFVFFTKVALAAGQRRGAAAGTDDKEDKGAALRRQSRRESRRSKVGPAGDTTGQGEPQA